MTDLDSVSSVDAAQFADRRLVRDKPHMAPALGRTVRVVRSLWVSIAEHESHIKVLTECIQDEALRLMDEAEAETIGEEVDVLDALSWHCSMTFCDAEIALQAAKKRRRESDD